MKKVVLLLSSVMTAICFFVSGGICSYAEESPNKPAVGITSDVEFNPETMSVSGTAHIVFDNPELYNENVKFSFHIYDADSNEIVFETVRYSFLINEDNTADIPFAADLANSFELSGKDELHILYDLIDESKLYWFSQSDAIDFHTDTTVCIAERYENNVSIRSETKEAVCYLTFTDSVTVTVENPKLINDSLKLSYHIVDSLGEDIRYENERIPLVFTDGVARADVSFSLGETMKKNDDFFVVYDIVDEINSYWFSSNDIIKLDADSVHHTYDFGKDFAMIYENILVNQPIQVCINLAVCILIVVLVIIKKRKKGERFESKR